MAGAVRATALAAAAIPLAAAAPASAQSPGAEGVADPFFPKAGNGGYEVRHYAMRLHFDPRRDRLRAWVGIRATATQDLSSFNLDFRGPEVTKVEVDRQRATYRGRGQELVVTPDAALAAGAPFSVSVRYAGRPHPIKDPDGSKEGWFHTRDGSVVVAEPQGSPTWYPANDHPTDKATFSFEIFVPRGLEAIANGRLLDRRTVRRQSVWHWKQREPMAPYLATVATGRFRLDRSRVAGIRSVIAVDPRLWKQSRPSLERSGEILSLLEELFGPYPFGDVGAIVDEADFIGYALETQTRPVYDRPPDEILIAHELAHQWIGNSVTLSSWPEIWLHEGFATWAEWRWAEEDGGPSTARLFDELYATPASKEQFWNPPPAALPGPQKLFSGPVYVRGAMALEVLRQEIGNQTFLALLREWAQQNADANVTIADFIALAEARAGDSMLSETVFGPWLYEEGKPPPPQ